MQRRVIEVRDVPDVEVERPERQRDERMGQDAQPLDHLEAKHRAKDLAGQPEHEAERREVAEDHVLRHVEEEEMLLAERVDRRVEREHDERDAGPERGAAPTRHRAALSGERPATRVVEERRDDRGDDLERFERPGREERRRIHVA